MGRTLYWVAGDTWTYDVLPISPFPPSVTSVTFKVRPAIDGSKYDSWSGSFFIDGAHNLYWQFSDSRINNAGIYFYTVQTNGTSGLWATFERPFVIRGNNTQ